MNDNERECRRSSAREYGICRLAFQASRNRYLASSSEIVNAAFWSVLLYTVEVRNAVIVEDGELTDQVVDAHEVRLIRDGNNKRTAVSSTKCGRWKKLLQIDQIIQEKKLRVARLNFPGARVNGVGSYEILISEFQTGEHVFAHSTNGNCLQMSIINAVKVLDGTNDSNALQ